MSEIQSRKSDHIDLCSTDEVRFRERGTLLGDVQFVHDALPELSDDELDTSVTLFGKRLRLPLIIAAMTGGTDQAREINRVLATLAEEQGVGFGLGSQRAMLRSENLTSTYDVRSVAPTALLLGNLGVVQARDTHTAETSKLMRDVGADAMCVHLNPAMELIQNCGDRDFRGGIETLARLARELPIPVIAKETGCGISASAGGKLLAAGIEHIDVSGAGGTSWVGVEALRAERNAESGGASLGQRYWDWGIPTAVSVATNAPLGFKTLIATGGVSNGLDAARALALGAHAVGIARPFLQAVHAGGLDAGRALIASFERELRTAMLLTGSRDCAALQKAPRVILGELENWLRQLANTAATSTIL